jgi:ATP-binding cassette, subfamily B, bacterial
MEQSKSLVVRNWRVTRFIWSLSPGYFLSYIASFLIQSLLPYIPIYGGALIINAIVAGSNYDAIMPIVWWTLSLSLFFGILSFFFTTLLQAWDNKILAEISRRMSKKTHELSYAQLEDNKTLRLMKAANEATNGSGGVPSYMAGIGTFIKGLSNLVYSIALLQGIFAIGTPKYNDAWSTFLNNPWSSLIPFGAVLLAVLLALPIMAYLNKLSYKAMMDNVEGNRRFGYFYTLCNDYQMGKDIRLFSMQKLLISYQEDNKNGVNEIWEGFEKSEKWFTILISLLYAILSFVAYAFLGLKALYGLIGIGSAVAYAGAVTLLASGINDVISGLIGMNLNSNYLQNYFIYLSFKNTVVYGQEKINLSQPLSLEFSHVSFTYPNQKEKALDDVSLTIRPGEKLAIVGVNGAGKTTLMKLVCRLYEPEAGQILVNGIPLTSYDQASCEKLYAIVFQDFKLFSFSVKDNVASSDQGDEAKVIESLKRADIEERIEKFPQGINTILYNKNDENGVEISGGEAQKIAIARALYKDAPLVILDEPTSALDPKSEAEVYEKFGTLVQGKTSVFISHRMSSTKFCDEIAVINHGQIVEYGNHKTLMQIKGGLYQQMWNAQAQYYK